MRLVQAETKTFEVVDLGLIDYDQAYEKQKDMVRRVIAGGPQTLFVCEHPSVVTMGRLANDAHILQPLEDIQNRGIAVTRIDRGGEVTLHSPGQVVVYPIFNLNHYGRDLKSFLHKLEYVTIELLGEFDIVARRIPGQRGVWVQNRKIASIGIGVKKWVSFHGMAINVNTDLNLFSMIRPCGLDVTMTSLQALTGREIDINSVKERVIELFEKIFQREGNDE